MKYSLALLASILFISCGGAGLSTPGTVPTADAGPLQDVNVSTEVTLDGSASSDRWGAALTYSWTQTSGTEVTLSDSTAVRPTFTTGAAPGTYAFSLIVNNGAIDSDPATMTTRVWVDSANKVFVNPSSSGMSLSKAGDDPTYTTISSAIANAAGSDVYVATGTYTENITMVEGVSIYGGYESSGWTRDISENTTTINPATDQYTIVAGSGITNATVIDGFSITGPTADVLAYAVSVGSGGSPTISNNTITGGAAAGVESAVVGIHCVGGASGLVISDNSITIGTSTGTEGVASGIVIDDDGCTATISGNTVNGSDSDTYSAPGGAVMMVLIASSATSITVEGNTIDAGKNTSVDDGVGTLGLSIRELASVTVSRNRIDGGDGLTVGDSPGSFAISLGGDATAVIENNIIYSNGSTTYADGTDSMGISVMSSSNADIVNNTIYMGSDTTSSDQRVVILNMSDGVINVVNNLLIKASDVAAISQVDLSCISAAGADPFNSVFNNAFDVITNGVFYSYAETPTPVIYTTLATMETQLNVQQAGSAVSNIAADPLLQSDSDYLLQADSPCIDVGCTTDCGVTIPSVDFDGNARPNGSAVDIGASEYY